MGEAVEQCGCHFRVAEHRRPLAEAEVCRDHDTCALVELAHQMEQQRPARGAEREISEFVEDHHVGAHQGFGDLASLAACLLLLKGIDEFDGGEEAHLLAMMLDRLDAERRGEMGFSGSCRSSFIMPVTTAVTARYATGFIRFSARP